MPTKQRTFDETRDFDMQNDGYQVLRFWNKEVDNDFTRVLNDISSRLKSMKVEPSWKSQGRTKRLL